MERISVGGRLGILGEDAAVEHYRRRGYRLLARNWTCRIGELDLVLARGSTVVFCEVKARSGSAFGGPHEAVTWRKQRKLRALAMYGRVFAVAVVGVRGHLISVEAHVGRGLPALTLTGLPGAGIQDARERVRPAVESSGLTWPLRRVVVNLSPAGIRKEGPGFDLPIALGVLAASAQVPATLLGSYAFAGELSLKGELVGTAGILPVAMAAITRAPPASASTIAIRWNGSSPRSSRWKAPKASSRSSEELLKPLHR